MHSVGPCAIIRSGQSACIRDLFNRVGLQTAPINSQRSKRSFATSESDTLFISTVWPERSSSAAGVRTDDLIDGAKERGRTVAYACTSSPNSHTNQLQQKGVSTFFCPPNSETAALDVFGKTRPSVVVFDRFYAEEMFSFRVKTALPDALRVMDMQDCHALREGRQQLAKQRAGMAEVMACRPDTSSQAVLRELSSIYRSDLTLVCSPAELQLLTQHYGVPESKLALAPFFPPPSPHAALPVNFSERRHVMMIGNWVHGPNFDSVRWACSEVWPMMRHLLAAAGASAELHLYGAYAPSSASQLHRPEHGIHLKGFAPTLDVMTEYKVCLAPLRYGAGLKGKIVDSWWHGLPVCTTPIGAEGMNATPAGAASAAAWGGLCDASTAGQVAADAARLYTDAGLWERCQLRGFELLHLLYDRRERLDLVDDAIQAAHRDLQARRATDFAQAMLWQQSSRSTEFFSRWIELKERQAARLH